MSVQMIDLMAESTRKKTFPFIFYFIHIVIGLAAVIIGEVLFGKFASKRKLAFAFTLASVILGAVIYYMVYQFVLWLKMPSEDMKLFSAIVVAIFLAIPYLKEKRTLRKGASK